MNKEKLAKELLSAVFVNSRISIEMEGIVDRAKQGVVLSDGELLLAFLKNDQARAKMVIAQHPESLRRLRKVGLAMAMDLRVSSKALYDDAGLLDFMEYYAHKVVRCWRNSKP